MARKRESSQKQRKSKKREVVGIVLVVLSLILLMALVSHDPGDWPGSSKTFDEQSHNWIGWYGAATSHYLFAGIGWTAYALALFMLAAGVVIFLHRPLALLWKPLFFLTVSGLFIPLLAGLTFDIGADNTRVEPAFHFGGILGGLIAHYMVTYLGRIGTYLVAVGTILVSLVLTTNFKPSSAVDLLIAAFGPIVRSFSGKTKDETPGEELGMEDILPPGSRFPEPLSPEEAMDPFLTPVEPGDETDVPIPDHARLDIPIGGKAAVPVNQDKGDAAATDFDLDTPAAAIADAYLPPGTDLLDEPPDDLPGESRDELLGQAARLVESLRHFNIEADVRQITPGPIVTRYEITLAPGIKVGRIVNLANDLTMALKARGGIRILAPIPGKDAVGIEVPNRQRQVVYFREIVESDAFRSADRPLLLAIGKTTAGDPVVADLARMPHLLIAGSTGSGKSVCINTLVCSILMKAGPGDVRMIMIDPKVVELGIYNDIPHLLTPVITDSGRAANALRWAVKEMESRYQTLAKQSVRDIYQYNAKVDALRDKAESSADEEQQEVSGLPERLPFIVIIIDEFADLMAVSSNEVEESIARIAQMARAVGIHLVLATQRPSADVITGLIKANFPSRIAFKVMQASNSRIILDESGADKLLGMGDMLFLQAGKPESVRMHGAYISGDECARFVSFITEHAEGTPERIAEDELKDDVADGDNALGLRDPHDRDSLFFEAARLVVRHNQGSVSLLQRRLRIGYARAARLIDQLELAGIVTAFDGSKAREVLADDMYIDALEAGELDI